MRVALLAVLCALLGGAAALGLGRAAGLVGGSTAETVVVRQPPAAAAAPAARLTAPAPVAAAPGFSAARIFADRSPGVVTVFAYFGGVGAQGSGFVVSRDGTILTNAHVITNAGATAPGAKVKAASEVYVEFGDHDRVPASSVAWDRLDAVGVIHGPPGRPRLTPLARG